MGSAILLLLLSAQNSSAQIPLEEKYAEVQKATHSHSIVRNDSLWGVVDKENEIKLPFVYKSITFNDLVYKYIFQGQNGKYGFTDVAFDKTIQPSYDSIRVLKTKKRNHLQCWKGKSNE